MGTIGGRCHAQLAAERRKRNVHAGQEGARAVGQPADGQRRVGEFIGQQAEAGDVRGPAPIARLEFEQLDLERVAGLGTFNGDGSVHLVDPREVERGDVADRGGGGDLTARGVKRIDLDDGTARNRGDRLDGSIPG